MARDYGSEYQNYQGKPEQIRKRSARNKARRKMIKAGRARVGDGKDVDHKKPLAKGGSNSLSNLRIRSKAKNRSFKRTKDAGMA